MVNPGDLLVLDALAQQKTFSGAAKSLNVSHTTVARKIRDLEAHYGARLIERVADRVVLTSEGEAAVASAHAIRDELRNLDRRIEGRDGGLFGHITLTTVDILAVHYMDKLARFSANFPEIDLTLNAETAVRSLSRREAEVALRLTNTPEPYLFGKQIGRYDYCHYTSKSRTEGAMNWLDYASQDCANRSATWMKEALPGVTPKSYFSSPLMMMHAIQAGLGDGLLPKQVAENNSKLRLVNEEVAFSLDIWLLAPKELRHTARVRALIASLATEQ
ncbi:LysR family transcriptional regulator [Halocynthiibacter sp. C4]|uniref:LysR family transcriptional regulator n=1 Tax=Halocynthiibacter sp. C4 TaxID=2992758 RepID=UPI00237B3323|nr:LysR family transcriptional regulator [Halocynthiibacter sp. C4]MDE0591049.1 LysR family transcriptional regulator [Halocynthiibacter sp. C4]